MDNFNLITITRVEQRTCPIGGCPVDIMQDISSNAEGPFVILLNQESLAAMMLFRPVDKKIEFASPKVLVTWLPSMQTMELLEINESSNYVVIDADTDELKYHVPLGQITLFLIEMKH